MIRLLIVDDDPAIPALVKALLKPSPTAPPVSVDSAKSLEEATQKLAMNEYDGIFLDLHLPDSDGLEAAETVRKIAPDIPLVLVSGIEISNLIQITQKIPKTSFLQKDDLLNRLSSETLPSILKTAQ